MLTPEQLASSTVDFSLLLHNAQMEDVEEDGISERLGKHRVFNATNTRSGDARAKRACENNAYGYLVTGFGYLDDHEGETHFAQNHVKSYGIVVNPCGM